MFFLYTFIHILSFFFRFFFANRNGLELPFLLSLSHIFFKYARKYKYQITTLKPTTTVELTARIAICPRYCELQIFFMAKKSYTNRLYRSWNGMDVCLRLLWLKWIVNGARLIFFRLFVLFWFCFINCWMTQLEFEWVPCNLRTCIIARH